MANRKWPIITLLTDFGLKTYMASMRGVILSINPKCTLVDITHMINSHDIKEGAFILGQAYSNFPKGTIHLSVVDPGVGSARKPILIVTKNYFFVGPDNGLFTIALRRERVKQAVVLTNQKFFLPEISTTFHGRDIFAPAAAYLSLGVKPESFGPSIKSWHEISFSDPPRNREINWTDRSYRYLWKPRKQHRPQEPSPILKGSTLRNQNWKKNLRA
jgi:S-adenosylmethionine hydrolase